MDSLTGYNLGLPALSSLEVFSFVNDGKQEVFLVFFLVDLCSIGLTACNTFSVIYQLLFVRFHHLVYMNLCFLYVL